MSQEGSRFLAFVAATVALGLVIAVFGSKLLGSAAGADGQIITFMKRLEREGVEEALPFAPLLASRLQFQRISVVLDADGQGATVTSTLDLTGEVRRLRAPHTTVSSLGLESARFRLKDGEWVPDGSVMPRLERILAALERRRQALERGERQPDGGIAWPEVSGRTYSSLAWYIRSEREDVAVSEDYRLQGTTPDKPVDEKATRRLSLQEDSAGLFSFPDGIL
jgi:hypothetical protein